MNDLEKKIPRKGGLSPLWVISVFLTFAETVLGYAVTQTQATVQMILTGFVVLFPTFICIAFFRILWKRPYVLYPPGEYGGPSVTSFVEAMKEGSSKHIQSDDLIRIVNKAFEGKVTELKRAIEQLVGDNLRGDQASRIEHIIGSIRQEAESSVRQAFLRIDSRPLLGTDGYEWDEPYTDTTTVQQLLDGLWMRLQPHVPPYSYQTVWILKDAETGYMYKDLGLSWAVPQGLKSDKRSLKMAGIHAGATLEITSP